jgi:hypothetical protein
VLNRANSRRANSLARLHIYPACGSFLMTTDRRGIHCTALSPSLTHSSARTRLSGWYGLVWVGTSARRTSTGTMNGRCPFICRSLRQQRCSRPSTEDRPAQNLISSGRRIAPRQGAKCQSFVERLTGSALTHARPSAQVVPSNLGFHLPRHVKHSRMQQLRRHGLQARPRMHAAGRRH